MDLTTILQIVGYIPSKIHGFIMQEAIQLGLGENLATRMSPLVYWLVIALMVWLTISLLEKLNVILKFVIFLLIAILVIGFFVPIW